MRAKSDEDSNVSLQRSKIPRVIVRDFAAQVHAVDPFLFLDGDGFDVNNLGGGAPVFSGDDGPRRF